MKTMTIIRIVLYIAIGTVLLLALCSCQTKLPKLYEKVSPAVVWIGAEYSETTYYELTFWEKIFGNKPKIKHRRGAIKWQGSGFIISPDGLVATAGHVVENTETFQLVFSDGRWGRAIFVYREDSTICDVGFIQITWIQRKGGFHILEWLSPKVIIDFLITNVVPEEPIKNLPYVNFTSDVELAEEVAIIGYPWGLQDGLTITQGIVSAINRNVPFFGEKLMLHTDAASWPGNSGSPVFNLEGKVIGILVGGIWNADNYSLCTPAKIVMACLEKYKAQKALEELK